jgi:hypothetical protein
MPGLRFLSDHHVNARALTPLQAAGLDIVHVAEVGLGEADDAEILAWAAAHERIVVTRNYHDFAPLAEAYVKRGLTFPGVLFFESSVRQSDAGHHARALHEWFRGAAEAGGNPVENGLGWLR